MDITYEDVCSVVWSSKMGKRLKSVREDLCLTQRDFSKKLKITQATLSKIERGDIRHAGVTFGLLRRSLNEYLIHYVLTGK